MIAIIFWKLVQLLILVVILKFGKPLQEDTKVLIANKLMKEFNERELHKLDEKAMFEKR